MATIRGQLDFEGGVYRDRCARTYTTSILIVSLFNYLYARKMRVRIGKFLPCSEISRAAFIGTSLVDRCGDILRAAGFRGVAAFRVNMVFAFRLGEYNVEC